jgi:hypothetical protein
MLSAISIAEAKNLNLIGLGPSFDLDLIESLYGDEAVCLVSEDHSFWLPFAPAVFLNSVYDLALSPFIPPYCYLTPAQVDFLIRSPIPIETCGFYSLEDLSTHCIALPSSAFTLPSSFEAYTASLDKGRKLRNLMKRVELEYLALTIRPSFEECSKLLAAHVEYIDEKYWRLAYSPEHCSRFRRLWTKFFEAIFDYEGAMWVSFFSREDQSLKALNLSFRVGDSIIDSVCLTGVGVKNVAAAAILFNIHQGIQAGATRYDIGGDIIEYPYKKQYIPRNEKITCYLLATFPNEDTLDPECEPPYYLNASLVKAETPFTAWKRSAKVE